MGSGDSEGFSSKGLVEIEKAGLAESDCGREFSPSTRAFPSVSGKSPEPISIQVRNPQVPKISPSEQSFQVRRADGGGGVAKMDLDFMGPPAGDYSEANRVFGRAVGTKFCE